MSGKKLLIVEDEDTTRNILENMVQTLGYNVTTAANGVEALELFKNDPFLVILTDIEMPEMDGNELISNLKEMENPPVIIVQTVNDDVSQIVETMKKGVFDYIVKPVSVDDISYKLIRAFEVAELRTAKNVLTKEKEIRLESQFEWMNWNQEFFKRDYDRIDQALFKSLHTSFNQGAGFGALLTLIQLITSSAVKQGEKYVIDNDIFQLLNNSAAIAQKTIDTFAEINLIFNQNIKFELLTSYELLQLIRIVVDDMKKYSEIKNQKILLSEKRDTLKNMYLNIDSTLFSKAIKELFFNALKFSKENTSIYIIYEFHNNNFHISIIK
jgi:CheY-like chemotaxis protein